jgi:hypothetical protein
VGLGFAGAGVAQVGDTVGVGVRAQVGAAVRVLKAVRRLGLAGGSGQRCQRSRRGRRRPRGSRPRR